MNEDFINSFLNEVNQQTEKSTTNNSLFPAESKPDVRPEQPNLTLAPAPVQEQTEPEPKQEPEKTNEIDTQSTFSFFGAAVEQAKQDSEKRLLESLITQNPVFLYSKAMKEIVDPDTTFEDLRLQNVGEYPELDSKDREVKWSVVYGSVVKSITEPNRKVFEVKSEIEQSQTFLDGLKKAKKEADKKPKCYVKVTVVFQRKGKANVIQMFPTLEDAIASEQEVTYVLLKDGALCQVRNNEIGIFIAPADESPGQQFQNYRHFEFQLPRIPAHLLLQIISFFQYISQRDHAEGLVNILYDKTEQKYICDVPEQTVSGSGVTANAEYDDNLYLHVMDIHSHNSMPAFFSGIDDEDELASRLYMVIGKLDEAVPQIKLRASCGGRFIPLDLKTIFDIQADSYPFPREWLDKLTIRKQSKLNWFHFLKEAIWNE